MEYDEPMKLMQKEGSLFGQLVKEYWSHIHAAGQPHSTKGIQDTELVLTDHNELGIRQAEQFLFLGEKSNILKQYRSYGTRAGEQFRSYAIAMMYK